MSSTEGLKLVKLARMPLESGDVLHILKATDAEFIKFGEAYFSFIKYGAIKAWKLHRNMTLNLVVPIGAVKFVFFSRGERYLNTITLGEDNYSRLTVKPGIWFGFKGVGVGTSLILNVADIQHDPGEVVRKDKSEISFDWGAL